MINVQVEEVIKGKDKIGNENGDVYIVAYVIAYFNDEE